MARMREHRRKSVRLPGYDYSQPGAYFVTIVCKNREPVFEDPVMRTAVEEAWQWLGNKFQDVELDAFVVMPNHVHGVLFITDRAEGRSQTAPTGVSAAKPLGRLVGAFKTRATSLINAIRVTPTNPVWQRNYHEHVVRIPTELNRIRQYIADNPLKWDEDPETPIGAKIT